MRVTALDSGLLALLFLALSFRVIFARRDARIAIGDGGSDLLRRRMRVHANFAEYAPFALVLIGLAESLGNPALLLHGLGLGLLAGRIAHAYGVSQEPEPLIFRQFGMILTFAVIGITAALCIASGLAVR
jgi:hypothetical protein